MKPEVNNSEKMSLSPLVTDENKYPLAYPRIAEAEWSYSRISTYERCERQYFYKYIEKRPIILTVPLEVGRILHTSIQWCLKYGYEPEEALRFAIYDAGRIPDGENFDSLLELLSNSLYYIPNGDIEINSEMYVSIKTTLGTIRGYIDVLIEDWSEDRLEISDYKSGWKLTEASDSIQLGLYAWMLKEIKGASMPSNVIGKLIFPRILKESEVNITDELMAAAKQWIVHNIKLISKKTTNIMDWARTSKNENCESCPFAGKCAIEIKQEGFASDGVVDSIEEAALMGQYIALQELYLKQLKKGMKSFVEKHGPVSIGKKAWQINESIPSPKVIDMEEFLHVAEEKGENISSLVNADSEKLQKLLDVDDTGKLEQIITWTKTRKTLKLGELKNG